MAIPDYQHFMLPVLQKMGDGSTRKASELTDFLAAEFKLSEEEKVELLPSGKDRLSNRTQWAVYSLYRAGLLSRERRGHYCISDAGRQVLSRSPEKINVAFLMQFESFQRWQKKSNDRQKESATTVSPEGNAELVEWTPLEAIQNANNQLHAVLMTDLLDRLSDVPPQRFEKLVLDLLIAMGYGGSRTEAAKVTRASNDGGIDGTINEDRLGLDVIYVQAKRYQNPVPIHHVRDFAGALLGKRARKGIFITTSDFPASAYEFVSHIEQKIILIDGKRLAQLMIEHDIGVSREETIEIKRIDSDYFEEL